MAAAGLDKTFSAHNVVGPSCVIGQPQQTFLFGESRPTDEIIDETFHWASILQIENRLDSPNRTHTQNTTMADIADEETVQQVDAIEDMNQELADVQQERDAALAEVARLQEQLALWKGPVTVPTTCTRCDRRTIIVGFCMRTGLKQPSQRVHLRVASDRHLERHISASEAPHRLVVSPSRRRVGAIALHRHGVSNTESRDCLAALQHSYGHRAARLTAVGVDRQLARHPLHRDCRE